ncbi:MAG TPA: NAD-dependent epimerase, partial [Deltaproteobacteria bacterium]|nr:NAD-dependent epimerase [Deltaproteobacteria bacterium]
MKAAVTGATGHIGANLVRHLMQMGIEVRVLVHRDRRGIEGLGLDHVEGSVLDKASLSRLFEGVDVAYHLAALISITGDPDGQVRRTNVNGAENAARAALEAGVGRFVHVSSVHAYDLSRGGAPIDESSVPSGSDRPAYDYSKALGQARVKAVIADGLDGVLVNPVGVVGPGDFRPSRMGHFFLDLAHRRLPALVEGGFTWVDVRDVVTAMVAASERGSTGQNYLLGGPRLTTQQLADVAQQVIGVVPPRLVTPLWMARLGAPLMEWSARATRKEPLYTREALDALETNPQVDDSLARAELGHVARPMEETVRDTYAWFA